MDRADTKPTPKISFPDLKLVDVEVSHGKHLPHWEASHATYHITFHLADSVPQEQLAIWRAERARLTNLARQANRPLTESEIEEMRSVFNLRVERYLASGFGACLLRRPDVGKILADVLEHSNGTLYSLHAWCIMPNHVHVIAGGFTSELPVGTILSKWKSISGHAINKALARSGAVWHKDAYTRIIRDEAEYARQMGYVWHNPDSAGLADGFLRRRYVP